MEQNEEGKRPIWGMGRIVTRGGGEGTGAPGSNIKKYNFYLLDFPDFVLRVAIAFRRLWNNFLKTFLRKAEDFLAFASGIWGVSAAPYRF